MDHLSLSDFSQKEDREYVFSIIESKEDPTEVSLNRRQQSRSSGKSGGLYVPRHMRSKEENDQPKPFKLDIN